MNQQELEAHARAYVAETKNQLEYHRTMKQAALKLGNTALYGKHHVLESKIGAIAIKYLNSLMGNNPKPNLNIKG